jgi:thioredoxin reductase (NADPH)
VPGLPPIQAVSGRALDSLRLGRHRAGPSRRAVSSSPKNDGKRIIPTIVFEDGSFLVEPSNAELAAKLGLKTAIDRKHFPLIVVGGGPAGLTTALYTAREGIDTLVIERAAFGGQAAGTENWTICPVSPTASRASTLPIGCASKPNALAFSFCRHRTLWACAHMTTTTVCRRPAATSIQRTSCRDRHRQPLPPARCTPGERDYIGAGVHFCATCDGPFYKGKHVAVIGGGNSAAEESLLLTKFADRVTMLVRGDSFKASKVIQESVLRNPKIDVHFDTEVLEFRGAQAKLNALLTRNNRTGVTKSLRSMARSSSSASTRTRLLCTTPVCGSIPWGFIVTGHDLVHDGDRPAALRTARSGRIGDQRAGHLCSGRCAPG